MTPEDRVHLGRKVVTVRWWEESEVKALTKQGWFDSLRADLNASGKVTLNLGLLKYEQGGSGRDLSEAEQARLVSSLFQKTPITSRDDFNRTIRECIDTGIFEPRFVLMEGELVPQLSFRKDAEMMLAHAADFLGFDITPRVWPRAIPDALLKEYHEKIEGLFRLAGGTRELATVWARDPRNLVSERVRGVDMPMLLLDTIGDREHCTAVVCPERALNHLPDLAASGARVLGWTEHGRGGSVYVRAIAIASVLYLH